MEAFTSGKASADARRSYLEDHPAMVEAFRKVRGGYLMTGWESQIAMARACGRGTRAGRNLPPHKFDLAKEATV